MQHKQWQKMGAFKKWKEQVMNKMKDGNKVIGPDRVLGHILKECREELIDPIYNILKYSIETREVPKEWKRADVIPIYKGGSKNEPLNYKPISLTRITCKLCEK